MTDSLRRPLLPALLLLALTGCPEDSPPVVDTQGEAMVIRVKDMEMSEAASNGDAATFASYFAEDAVQMPPNQAPIVGRAAIQEAAGFGEGTTLHVQPAAVTVSNCNDLAYSRGTYHLTVETPDGTVEDEGSYLEIWQRLEGEWKITADIYHSDLPAPDGG